MATTGTAHAAFRYPSFRYYQVARFLIITAMEMQSVAVGWQIYEITHRPLDLGLAGLAQFLPGIFLFLPAGHAADRLPRKRILMFCYAALAVCSGLLYAFTARGMRTVEPIYGVLLLIGVVRSFNAPTGQAFLPLLVPEEHFANAVAWGSSVFNTATIFGPVVGGLVYGWMGSAKGVYGAAAVSFALALGMVSLIRPVVAQQAAVGRSARAVLAGFEYVWRNKLVLGAISLDLFAVLLGGAVALLPVYAREILHTGPWGLGLLRSAPGVGAVMMAVVMAYWPLRRRAGATMLWCVAGFGVATIVFGLSHNLVVSMVAMMAVGATDMVSVVVRATMVQLATPDAMRGRVSSVNMLFIGASNEFGQFESGITAQWMGTVTAVVAGGIGTLVIVALWAWKFPELRNVDRLEVKEMLLPEEANVVEGGDL